MAKTKLGLVGIGKIARDQHLPVIAASADFELVATASRNASVEGAPAYASLAAMLDAHPNIQAVSLCTPPGPREADALRALACGLHVLLEKPPATTLSAARAIVAAANQSTLCASWHSRHAPGVAAARDVLRDRVIRRIDVIWKEDIRRWHPGQDWILDAGGMGVFDPGINALSILTHIVPGGLILQSADLDTPGNRQAPIAARLRGTAQHAPVSIDLDFLTTGEQIWDIDIATEDGAVRLSAGGAHLSIDGVDQPTSQSGRHHEYEGVYRHFADLIRAKSIDADLRPLELVADAFLSGRRRVVADFVF